MIGQTISAIGFPFLNNAPSKVSANWFGENERIYSTAFAANFQVIGMLFGVFMPSMFVKDTYANVDQAKNDIFNL